MGTMSASNAAPLPRLGEVFFDVRSAARSLRISWYADTGVAVLSIWQGGTCTGSFRLPMADLPRMIEALQRGPDGLAGSGIQDQAPSRQSVHAGQPGPAAAAGGYPPHPDPSRYPGEPGPAHYPEQPGQSRYPGEPGQAYYRQQPSGPGGAHQLVPPPAPAGAGRPDSVSDRPPGDGLEPLPESFPYSLRLPDHELR